MAACGLGLGGSLVAQLDFPTLCAKIMPRSKTKGFAWRSWREYEVEQVENLNSTTKKIRFAFEDNDLEAGIRVVSVILGRCKGDGDQYVRAPYYPVTRNSDLGHFDLVVKRTEDPVSQHLHSLKVGDKAEFKGALPILPYRVGQYSTLGLVAGGTGIIPLYMLIQEILSNPQETTKISLLYAAKDKSELLFKSHLDKLAQKHPQQFRVEYCVEQKPWFWSGHVGRLTKQMVASNMPRPGRAVTIAVSGPESMMEAVCGTTDLDKAGWPTQGPVKGLLHECGYRKSHVFKF
mmetsp:Transcript_53491/g.87507  ORF Transcript_53491/g.87507 Transcript_53491/m.87507 type:complete len:290 (+) Transcript_53491:1-870(+)